jgi:hypothetical protein
VPPNSRATAVCTNIRIGFQAPTGDGYGWSGVQSRKGSPARKISLEASPSFARIAPGQSASTSITVSTDTGAFDAPVSFSCSNLPAGMTCSFAPKVVTSTSATGSSLLTVSAASVMGVFQPVNPAGKLPISIGPVEEVECLVRPLRLPSPRRITPSPSLRFRGASKPRPRRPFLLSNEEAHSGFESRALRPAGTCLFRIPTEISVRTQKVHDLSSVTAEKCPTTWR